MTQEAFASRANPDFQIECKPKLLLVDENAEDLRHYTAMLRSLGYKVRSAGSYKDAAALLGQEAFDLVIVDQGSTDFEGRLVLRRAVEIDHQTPVLVLTGTVDVDCCLRALDMGAHEYVQKPLTRSEVQALVDDYLKPSMNLSSAGRELLSPADRVETEPWRKAS